jgi:hypothetical protein
LQVLVWPAFALFAMLMFRRQLSALLGRLRRADALGTSFDFEAEVIEAASSATFGPAEQELEAEPAPSANGPAGAYQPYSFNEHQLTALTLLAIRDDRRKDAIRRAWENLLLIIDRAEDHLGLTTTNAVGIPHRNPFVAIRQMIKLGYLDQDAYDVLNRLNRADANLGLPQNQDEEVSLTGGNLHPDRPGICC